MGKVFVVQEVKRWNPEHQVLERVMDISKAEVFGQVEVLLPGKLTTYTPALIEQQLASKLKDFGDDDYLCCVGDPTAIGAAAMYASRSNHGKVNFLKWDRDAKHYISITYNMNRKGE